MAMWNLHSISENFNFKSGQIRYTTVGLFPTSYVIKWFTTISVFLRFHLFLKMKTPIRYLKDERSCGWFYNLLVQVVHYLVTYSVTIGIVHSIYFPKVYIMSVYFKGYNTIFNRLLLSIFRFNEIEDNYNILSSQWSFYHNKCGSILWINFIDDFIMIKLHVEECLLLLCADNGIFENLEKSIFDLRHLCQYKKMWNYNLSIVSQKSLITGLAAWTLHTKKSALQNENIGVQNENFGYLFWADNKIFILKSKIFKERERLKIMKWQ
jgi:hypothetical protein